MSLSFCRQESASGRGLYTLVVEVSGLAINDALCVCVCVCVCVRARARVRGCVCTCVRAGVCAFVRPLS